MNASLLSPNDPITDADITVATGWGIYPVGRRHQVTGDRIISHTGIVVLPSGDLITQMLTKSPGICFSADYGKKPLSLPDISPPWGDRSS